MSGTCGCGHPLADHAWNQTGACMARLSDDFDCPCLSAKAEACGACGETKPLADMGPTGSDGIAWCQDCYAEATAWP